VDRRAGGRIRPRSAPGDRARRDLHRHRPGLRGERAYRRPGGARASRRSALRGDRFFGVSVNDYQPGNVLDLVRSGDLDAIQVIYNAFHQAPEEQLLPACAQHGVGVIVRVALDEGGLTGQITPETMFPAGDFRNSYFGGDRKTQVKQHADALTADLGISDDQLAEVALRYVLSHDAVSAVIPGMRTVQNVERNVAAGDGRALDAAQLAIVARHRWERNFYQPPGLLTGR
jgi:aryl-alcohol dehydrogenase-like predicted oxidoreductase